MIASVQFKNFKVLRNATLPLGRFTLLVGPNGSGKSTALQSLQEVRLNTGRQFQNLVTVGAATELVQVIIQWGPPHEGLKTVTSWSATTGNTRQTTLMDGHSVQEHRWQPLENELSALRVYALDAASVSQAAMLVPTAELAFNGGNLVAVLDQLRDRHPDRFEQLNSELGRWLPEFDHILFETPGQGQRSLMLRTRKSRSAIRASDLSQGTLFALAILTIAYLPNPPSIACFEEPDRGIHPRLLRRIQDALYRLCYPEQWSERRPPTQVIATTHSPYFLDLFKDHPDEIVIAQKIGEEARFESLSSRPDLYEILGSAALGEVWYSGILGGVPSEE
jgi:predicted ATPase